VVQDDLDEHSQAIQEQVLKILASKLDAADAQLKGFMVGRSSNLYSIILPTALTISTWKRSKYAMLKDKLDRSINDIEAWQHISLNPLWLMLMKA
jgi:hypothetical protein